MALCQKNAIDSAQLTPSLPDIDDLVWFILPDGTAVFRKWSTILAGLVNDDEEHVVIAAGSNVNNIINGESQFFLPNFINRRVRLIRAGQLQSRNPIAGSYYTFTPQTAEFTVVPAPSTNEVFQFQAY